MTLQNNKKIKKSNTKNDWIETCVSKKKEWTEFKSRIYKNETLKDDAFKKSVLTQPAAIKTVVDFSNSNNCVKFFDAGDVQANGFQIAEDKKSFSNLYRYRSFIYGFFAERHFSICNS